MFEPVGVVLGKCGECESLQARPRAVQEGLLAPNCKSYWYGRHDELAAKAPRPSLNATAPNRPERAEPDAGSERCLRPGGERKTLQYKTVTGELIRFGEEPDAVRSASGHWLVSLDISQQDACGVRSNALREARASSAGQSD